MANKDELKQKFWALKAQIEKDQAAVDAKRKKHDDQLVAARAKLKPVMDEIRKMEHPLFEKKQDLAAIARQLRGPDGIVDTALPEHTVNRSN